MADFVTGYRCTEPEQVGPADGTVCTSMQYQTDHNQLSPVAFTEGFRKSAIHMDCYLIGVRTKVALCARQSGTSA